MAKRTYQAKAYLVCDRCDKARTDTTFYNFVLDSLYLTLQEIIQAVPNARWLMTENTLTTVSGTQYVTIPTDMDVDSIVSIRDETNNFRSIRISPEDAENIDPGRDMAGDEWMWWVQRVNVTGTNYDRIYFINKPDSVDSLIVMHGQMITDPTPATSSVLPAKYENIEIDGALSKVWERLDSDSPLSDKYYQRFIGGIGEMGVATGLQRIIQDARKSDGQSDALYGHRPGTDRPFGPSWPADYNILP